MKPNLITREQAEKYYAKQSYPNWKPYCGKCRTTLRMQNKDYGWQCPSCLNKIDFNLMHLREEGVNSGHFVKETIDKAMSEIKGNILEDKYKYLADLKICVFEKLNELTKVGWISMYANMDVVLTHNAPKIEYMITTILPMKGSQ